MSVVVLGTDQVPTSLYFDWMSVGLGLLVNLVEHNPVNREALRRPGTRPASRQHARSRSALTVNPALRRAGGSRAAVTALGSRSPMTLVADLYHRHLGGEKVRVPPSSLRRRATKRGRARRTVRH